METVKPLAATNVNPANAETRRKRVPLNVPVLKLEVPPIPGYRLYWFRNDPGMLERAQDAGYEFVQRGETKINSTSIASNSLVSGNTDMGSNVSIVAGKEMLPDGQGVRLVLMKIKEEFYLEDKNAADVKASKQIETLMGGKLGQDKHDGSNTVYVKPGNAIPAMFKPKNPIKF